MGGGNLKVGDHPRGAVVAGRTPAAVEELEEFRKEHCLFVRGYKHRLGPCCHSIRATTSHCGGKDFAQRKLLTVDWMER